MRFYQRPRGTRILLTVVWTFVTLLWLTVPSRGHIFPPYMSAVWLIVGLLQVGNAWSYWQITDRDLEVHTAGFRRRYKLALIDHVGPPRTFSKVLAKTILIDYRGRQSIYVTVAEREQFEANLLQAVANHDHVPPTTGPLGLLS